MSISFIKNVSYHVQMIRSRRIHATAFMLKKKPGNAPQPAAASASNGLSFDSKSMTAALDGTVKQFQEKIKEAKSDKVSTEKFQSLEVDLGHGSDAILKSIATVAPRGNKINIVAFDPKYVKRIQTAIISKLGLPAEAASNDKQTVSVTIPQQSESKKQITAKLIKEAFENLRTNSTNKHSIASIRARYLNPLKKASTKSSGVNKDDLKKQTQEIEQLVKTYTNKLTDLYKSNS